VNERNTRVAEAVATAGNKANPKLVLSATGQIIGGVALPVR
jgi:hypothetical protein